VGLTNRFALIPNYRYASEVRMAGDEFSIFAAGMEAATGVSALLGDTKSSSI
jgi:hypothetical protein